MRSQLNGLKALIDAVGAITAAQVDGVNTVNPGDPANVTVNVIGNMLHFSFAIPRGNDGVPGANGSDGGPGPQGPPFANAVVDGVNTLNPGDPAAVTVSFDGTNVHFTFDIPRGNDGASGEVTTADMNTAIGNAMSGTSNNSNAVATLGLSVSDPPTQSDVQQIASKLDELINALRR